MKKIKELNNIAYHDGYILSYKKEKNNISFVIEDGWLNNVCYTIELKNVTIQVMENKPKVIYYVLNKFNDIKNFEKIVLFSGEVGKISEDNENSQYYLKLWIDYPLDEFIPSNSLENKYQFDGLDVNICNDYDDTGMFFIKFIADDINLVSISQKEDK